jgi:hypothetical protein
MVNSALFFYSVLPTVFEKIPSNLTSGAIVQLLAAKIQIWRSEKC